MSVRSIIDEVCEAESPKDFMRRSQDWKHRKALFILDNGEQQDISGEDAEKLTAKQLIYWNPREFYFQIEAGFDWPDIDAALAEPRPKAELMTMSMMAAPTTA